MGKKRRMASPSPDDEWGFTRWFPSEAAYVFIARRGIREFAERCGFEGQDLDDIESALGEAVAGAVESGGRPVTGVTVRAAARAGGIVIEVISGAPANAWANRIRDVARGFSAPRGYAILVMRRLMDRVTFGENGSLVRLFKRFP
jgi:anti-sigma regulatory factor (Ser/Thr protein kinase)